MKKPGLLCVIVLSFAALVLSGCCCYAPPISRAVDTYSTSTQAVRTSTYYGGGAYSYY
jgi:outer membrane biogenesis lipoprotein LolB